MSPERFGSLTLAAGHPDVVVLGGWGWTLAGSADAPVVERPVEPAEVMLAGRFGPGGGWAFAEVIGPMVTVRPVDDADVSFDSAVPNSGQWVVGDIDDDGRDDLIVYASGRFVLWRADGAGGFEAFAASQKEPAAQLYGHAPATQWAPPAVLVAEVSTGTSMVGLEVEEDVLVKSYTTGAAALVWWASGVESSAEASREILYVSYGGPLINPKQNGVGFLVGQDGAWESRTFRFAADASTQPRATDMDGDGTLDALVGAIGGDRLLGACTEGENELVPCLDVALEGDPESIAVDSDGQVWVATEDAGLWVYRLGPCQ